MTAMRFVSLETTGGFLEPLGSTTIGFDLRHFSLLLMDEYEQPRQCRIWPGCCYGTAELRGGLHTAPGPLSDSEIPWQRGSANHAKSVYFFFLGASTITICRPSIAGCCSIWEISSRSFSTRFSNSSPSSLWACSRPRNRMVTLALSPSLRKRVRLRNLIL